MLPHLQKLHSILTILGYTSESYKLSRLIIHAQSKKDINMWRNQTYLDNFLKWDPAKFILWFSDVLPPDDNAKANEEIKKLKPTKPEINGSAEFTSVNHYYHYFIAQALGRLRNQNEALLDLIPKLPARFWRDGVLTEQFFHSSASNILKTILHLYLTGKFQADDENKKHLLKVLFGRVLFSHYYPTAPEKEKMKDDQHDLNDYWIDQIATVPKLKKALVDYISRGLKNDPEVALYDQLDRNFFDWKLPHKAQQLGGLKFIQEMDLEVLTKMSDSNPYHVLDLLLPHYEQLNDTLAKVFEDTLRLITPSQSGFSEFVPKLVAKYPEYLPVFGASLLHIIFEKPEEMANKISDTDAVNIWGQADEERKSSITFNLLYHVHDHFQSPQTPTKKAQEIYQSYPNLLKAVFYYLATNEPGNYFAFGLDKIFTEENGLPETDREAVVEQLIKLSPDRFFEFNLGKEFPRLERQAVKNLLEGEYDEETQASYVLYFFTSGLNQKFPMLESFALNKLQRFPNLVFDEQFMETDLGRKMAEQIVYEKVQAGDYHFYFENGLAHTFEEYLPVMGEKLITDLAGGDFEMVKDNLYLAEKGGLFSNQNLLEKLRQVLLVLIQGYNLQELTNLDEVIYYWPSMRGIRDAIYHQKKELQGIEEKSEPLPWDELT